MRDSKLSPWCRQCGFPACWEHNYPCNVCGIDDGNFLIPTGQVAPDGTPIEVMLCRRHLPEDQKASLLLEEAIALCRADMGTDYSWYPA